MIGSRPIGWLDWIHCGDFLLTQLEMISEPVRCKRCKMNFLQSLFYSFLMKLLFLFLFTCFSMATVTPEIPQTELPVRKAKDIRTSTKCSEQLLIGKVLNGKYKIESKIRKGGFSVVFSASHNGENFAVKCLTKTNELSANREIAIMKRISHENLLSLVDSFVEDEQLFIVTELYGLDLVQVIKESYQLDIATAKKIMLQVASGVIYLHESGIYHRDLKPDNILVTSMDDLTVKICDFGASTTTVNSSNNFTGGTDRYLSPEIFNHQSGVSWAKNDVWAMGVTFYTMLTAKYPWNNPNEAASKKFGKSPSVPRRVEAFFKRVFTSSESRPSAEQFKQLLEML